MASSTMRLSGLISGMDTESIIQQLVSAKQTKVDDAVDVVNFVYDTN